MNKLLSQKKSNPWALAKRKFLALLTCAVSFSVLANTVDDSSANVSVDWQAWPVVGEAKLKVLFFNVYQSTLLTPDGRYKEGEDVSPHPLTLSIQYQRDITGEQLLNATAEQWQKLGFSDTDDWITTLAKVFPDVRDGDVLAYRTTGSNGYFYFRPTGEEFQRIAEVNDEQLNDAFLSIWLAQNSQYPKLRRQLIGN